MAAPQTLSALQISSFDRALHRAPQKASVLKDTVRVESGIMAENHRFPAIGKKVARTRAALQPIQANPSAKAKPQCNLDLFEDYEHLADHEVARTNVNAMTTYGMNSRDAVERRCDQWIVDAMDTINPQALGPGTLTTPAKANLDAALIGEAMAQLLNVGLTTRDMMTIAYNELQFEAIVKINALISRDYSERGFIATGRPPPMFGLQWRGMENRSTAEGGIGAEQAFMYAKNGVGLAMSGLVKLRDISWRNDMNAWQIGARIMGGATAIDKNMVLELALNAA